MKSRRRPANRRNTNRTKKLNQLQQKRAKEKDALDGSSACRKMEFEVNVSESESEESFPEKIRIRSKRLDIIVAETDPSEAGIESIDLFDESEEEETIGLRRSPRKRQFFLSSDESEYFDALDDIEKSATEKESSQGPSGSKDDKENDKDDESQLYYLKTVFVPLKDIGGLLQLHSNGRLTKDLTFSIRRNQTRVNRQSSVSSIMSDASSCQDPNDNDFNLSESSTSDSEDSTSSSGSTVSWESECESISSANSWLPRRRISSSEDSESQSDELEEADDDFVLHTKRTKKDLRKRKYLLRQSNCVIRSKVAKYCDESSEESSASSDE